MKPNPFVIRSAYGPKERLGDVGDLGPSQTKQSFTKECDINNILKKYQKTGALDHVNKHEAHYGFASSTDFTEAMETVARGQTMFNELPSTIRTKFENDPGKFLDFVQNPENKKEMQELGLAHSNELNEQEANQPLAKQERSDKSASADAKTARPSEHEASGTPKTGSD